MNEDFWMMTLGSALTLGSIAMLVVQVRARRSQADDEEDEFERRHMARRFRRRLQTTFLLALLGLFLALHPLIIPVPKAAPRLFAAWWMLALFVALWVVVLALADILSTSAHTKVALDRIHLRQRELQQRLENMQRRQSNGHDGHDEN